MEKNARNYGIDLLKLCAMLMVVILHVEGRGGVIGASLPGSTTYWIAWFFEIGAYCAVDCFALASGYTGYRSSRKISSLCQIWLRVLIYSIGITAIFAIAAPDIISDADWRNAFLPTLFNRYWYFTAYVCLFFLMPVLNMAIQNLGKRELLSTCIALMLLFSVAPTISDSDIFCTNNGYSAIWLAVLYILGGYIGKYGIARNTSPLIFVMGYSCCILSTFMVFAMFDGTDVLTLGNNPLSKCLISYTSPTILLAGCFLLLCFERLKITKDGMFQRLISFTVPSAFSVYLIHTHPLVFNNIIRDSFRWIGGERALVAVVAIIGSAVFIYLLCIGIDLLIGKALSITGVSRVFRLLDKKRSNATLPQSKHSKLDTTSSEEDTEYAC